MPRVATSLLVGLMLNTSLSAVAWAAATSQPSAPATEAQPASAPAATAPTTSEQDDAESPPPANPATTPTTVPPGGSPSSGSSAPGGERSAPAVPLTPSLPSPVVTYPDVAASFPPAGDEVASLRTRDEKHYRNPDGTYVAVFGHNLHYEAAPGQWDDVDLSFRPSGLDQVMDRSDVVVIVAGGGISVTGRSSHQGIEWQTPERPQVSGHVAHLSDQGVEWDYETTPTGVKLTGTVTAPRGPHRYEFSYHLLGDDPQDLVVNDSGELVGNGFVVPAVTVSGADGTLGAPGAWQVLSGGRVAFDLDDSSMSAGAFPYVIDPTTTFGSSANDGWGVTATSVSYPPPVGTSYDHPFQVGNDYLPAGGSNGRISCASACYAVTTGLQRWDTSSLPDTAVPLYAKVGGDIGTVDRTGADNAALFYSWAPWYPVGTEDYTAPPSGGFSPSFLVNVQPNAYNEFGFENDNIDGVSVTGATELRYHISPIHSSGPLSPIGSNGFKYTSTPTLKVVYCDTAAPPNTSYANEVLADNPVSYWPLDDSTVGGACDTNNANHGKTIGGVSIGQDSLIGAGRSMSFDGASGHIRIVRPSLQPSLNISIEGWIKTTAMGERFVMRSRWNGYGLYLEDGVPTAFVCGQDPDCASLLSSQFAYRVQGSQSVADGRWHHLAMTKDSSAVNLYVDGALVASMQDSEDIYYLWQEVAIGKDGGDGTGFFAGNLDEIAFYDHALSAERVAAHARRGGLPVAAVQGGGASPAAKNLGCPTGNATGHPVTTSTGNFWHTFGDVSLPGRGPSLDLRRTYNSTAAGTDGPFGPGWSSTYTMSAETDAGGHVTVHQENGAEVVFTPKDTGGYVAPGWATATLVHNGDGTYTLTRNARDVVTFGASGKLVSERDPNGSTTTVAYNGAGQITTVTDAAGRALTVTYGANAKIATITDPASRQVSYGYDGAGNLADVTDVGGGNTHFTYDGPHRMLTMRDQRGGVVTNHYDAAGRVDWQRDAMNRTTTLDYTAIPGSTKITEPAGNVIVHKYELGLLAAETYGYGTADAATWQREYETATLGCTKVTDPLNHTLTRTYDAAGNVLTSTDGLNRTTTFTYDALNDLRTVRDAKNVTTTFTYDAAGNLIGRSTPLTGTSQVQVSTFTHGDVAHPGDVTSLTDADGKVWPLVYDAAGNLTRATDPLGNATAYGYDAVGRRTSAVSARGTVAGVMPGCTPPALGCMRYSYAYDATGEGVTVTDPLGHVTARHYDRNGNLDSTTDADSHTTTSVFNADDEVTQVNRPDGTHLGYDHDANGNVTAQRDGANQATTYGYDSLDRVTSSKDPLLRETLVGYDKAGNRTSLKDPQGRTTTFVYDTADEVTSIDYSDVATPDVTRVDYDADGQRAGVITPGETSTWTWDSLHRMKTSTDGTGQAVTYGYDLRNHLTTIALAGSPTVTRGYDDAGRWTSVNDGRGHTTTFGYDPDADLSSQSSPNGINATNTFDDADQLTAQTNTKAGAARPSFTYGRGNKGQLSSSTAPGAGQPDQAYGYSNLDQLSAVNAENFSHDPADNLTRMASGGAQSYDTANELTSAPATNPSALWGTTADVPVPADYNGDGTTDVAIFRPSTNSWQVKGGATTTFGATGDIAVPADYTGDAKADIATFRPSTGGWYVMGGATTFLGASGDIPVPADYDGDGRADVATFRPSNSTWYVAPSGGAPYSLAYGASGDVPVPADYDGDGKADIGIFRAGVGLWVHQSSGGNVFFTYGIPGDIPVPADYDGDAKADVAVFRPSAGTWYVHRTSDNTDVSVALGASGDTPVPARYDADTTADVATFHPGAVAAWTVRPTTSTSFGYDPQGNRMFAAGPTGGSRYGYDQANRLTRAAPYALGSARLAAGENHSLVIDDTGAVWAWGSNFWGQVGNDTSLNSVPVPAKLTFAGNPKIVAVTGGSLHSAAIDANAKVWTWGSNFGGQQATGGTGFSKPTQVASPAFTGSGHAPTAIAAGTNHTLALRADGTVVAWGSNGSGQLGDGTTNGGNIFGSAVVQVSALTNVIAVAAGGDHSLALKRDGTVWSWGLNSSGELGNNSTANSSVPVRVGRLSGVLSIAAGHSHSLALGADGAVWAWGSNTSGQLGNASTANSLVPLRLGGISGVVGIAAGGSHSLAMRDADSVWAWGNNSSGQLGNNSTTASSVPVASALSGATAVAAGDTHSLAVGVDGTLRAWGNNASGQLGTGSAGGTALSPVTVTGAGSVRSPATTYAYNGDGLRMSKTNTSAVKTNFTWDLAGGLPLLLKEGSTSYVYGPGGIPLERIDASGNVLYYHHDQLGSTRMLTDSAGGVAATYTYDAYGRLAASTGSVSQPFGYAGEYTDAETGFQYLRARYYDAMTGQFLSRDPITALTQQPYAYTVGDPLNATDPSGLDVAGVCMTGTYGWGLTGEASICKLWDSDGGTAYVYSLGGGGGLEAGIGIGGYYSNAPSIDDILNWSTCMGGGVGAVSGEFCVFRGTDGNQYFSVDGSVGYSQKYGGHATRVNTQRMPSSMKRLLGTLLDDAEQRACNLA